MVKKHIMDKTNNIHVSRFNEYCLLLIFSILSLILTNSLLIIPDSHFYVSQIDSNISNESTVIYKSIRSPIYKITSFFYSSYDRYFLLSFTIYFILIITIYRVIKTYLHNHFLSFFILLLFSPLTFRVINFIIETNLIYTFNIFFKPFHDLSPIHFGWVTYGFTPRILSGICCLLLIPYFLNKQLSIAVILVALLFLVHPNNAISISLWLSLTTIFYLFYDSKYIKFLFANFVLLTLFILINTSNLNAIYSANEWYNLSYHINAPNFSSFYYFTENPLLVVSKLLIIVLSASFFYVKNVDFKNSNRKLLFLMSITPIIIFLGSLILEYLIRINSLDFSIIYRGIISSQVGLKILELSFFPLFISLMIFLSFFLKKYLLAIKYILFFVSIAFIFSTIFYFLTGRFTPNYKAISNKYDYTTTLKEIDTLSGTNPMLLPIINSNYDIDPAYLNQYSSIRKFLVLKKYIDANIKNNSLLIVPPYQDKFRDLFPNHEVFYQDVPDASLLLGGGVGSNILYKRINLLFNNSVLKFRQYHSNYYWSDMRNNYLNLNEKDLFKIKSIYRNRAIYFITESKIKLNLKLLYKSDFYCLYELL
jgi:hypothetical protein